MKTPLREREMQNAFETQVRKILSEPDIFKKNGDRLKIGFESEVAIVSDCKLSEIESARDNILGEIPDFSDKELGVSQIEIRTPPISLLINNGPEKLESVYRNSFRETVRAARKHGCEIIRCGTNPFLPVKNTPRTDKPKYKLVPDYYNKHRRIGVDTTIGLDDHKVDIGDAAIVSLFQSFQTNLEADSFADAIEKMNISFGIAPYLLALGANSRYLEYLDTMIQDIRLISWERSHDTGMQDLRLLSWERAFDTRTQREIRLGQGLRVGLPERYFRDMKDYLERAGRFPFILYDPPNALAISIGLTWLDSRVKFIGDSLVVELRLLPTQPTIGEELLLNLLYIGRLRYAQRRKETLLSIEQVRENRLAAMLYGMHSNMWFVSDNGTPKLAPYKEGIVQEVRKAEEGLTGVDLLRHLNTDLLSSILKNGSPSDRLARALTKIKDGNQRSRMRVALQKTKMLV